jgi:hypothetical protein
MCPRVNNAHEQAVDKITLAHQNFADLFPDAVDHKMLFFNLCFQFFQWHGCLLLSSQCLLP